MLLRLKFKDKKINEFQPDYTGRFNQHFGKYQTFIKIRLPNTS